MECIVTEFNGILLKTAQGNFAVNGGAPLETLEASYCCTKEPLLGFILTAEHHHRLAGVADFIEKYRTPFIGSMVMNASMLKRIGDLANLFIPPCAVEVCGCRFQFFHVRYDSIDPVGVTAECENRKIGMIFDGRLSKADSAKLSSCDELCLMNTIRQTDNRMLKRRYKSVYNSKEELETLFENYHGDLHIL